MGDDIVLWGVTLVTRAPGQPHPWQTDIESSHPGGGFVSVWIGLENTCQQSGLQLVTKSHLFGKSIQEVCHEKGIHLGTASSEKVFEWAQELDEDAAFLQPEVSDGEALIFDGRLWHGSYNALEKETRLALLLQYAKADRPVRIHDPKQLEWPFRVFLKARGRPSSASQGKATAPSTGWFRRPLPITKRVRCWFPARTVCRCRYPRARRGAGNRTMCFAAPHPFSIF
jgi:ectoine hydroxylase-related dioxygenase (phytanoyl-CoA dioxygenase family)